MTTGVVYPCDTEADACRAVYGYLFGSMRWNYWYEIAAALRYVGISREGISDALQVLRVQGKIEEYVAGDGRLIWRVSL